ncbi:MAG TPA: DEAD/DEAH box helicase family protein [Gemmatimonadaceae bacterium]|nr:DEAD/DEAH box helicase family protein [Gemmatimonadaceae bacterium]
MTDGNPQNRAAAVRERLAALEDERRSLQNELVSLERRVPLSTRDALTPAVTSASRAPEKIALFRRLFVGRDDVFPLRWHNPRTDKSGYAPACSNEWKPGICRKPQVKCGECTNQAFISLSDTVVRRHLGGSNEKASDGDFVAGVYPLLPDSTCRFLAVDFDGDDWSSDATAYLETCHAAGVTAALERSRSGAGGHVWIFFSDPVPARLARQLGSFLLTETMERRPEIGFASYDRLFPSQDIMPLGGFGNLIALPLQQRARQRANSVFVDADLHPYDDQWAFLSSLSPMSLYAVEKIVESAEKAGRVVGVRMPVEDDGADEPWLATPSRRPTASPIVGPLPSSVEIVLADGVYVDRTELPPPMVARLARLAAFQNPEFFRAQAMRFSTHGKPRVISCAELHPRHVALPRGCLDEAVELLQSHGVAPRLVDKREPGTPLDVHFVGALREEQSLAVGALSHHDFGVLAAATAFGKTVVAASLIAARGYSALVLVHRRELLTQWVERLASFLSIDRSDIGVIGGGRLKPTGKIDVAVIQSLVRRGVVSDVIAGYGHLVVDECHHLSAASFELVARRSKARYVLGLSATVARRDGHHPIILMQCGPVRYRVADKAQAALRGIEHRVFLRDTNFRMPILIGGEATPIAAAYGALGSDATRNRLIVDDIKRAIAAGRNPLVLTERRDHLEALASSLREVVDNVIVLRGGMKVTERRAAEASLRAASEGPRVLLSTGRYLGEGFDDARLDTLFLAMPVSWKGTLAQYVGRLHRDHHGKREVIVYDYVDALVPVLARMAVRRQRGYRALGYSIDERPPVTEADATLSAQIREL